MGLIKDFLKNKKEQKTNSLSLEEENKTLKNKIIELEDKLKEQEMLHAEEIATIDREFLSWYHKQNSQLNTKINKEERPEQEPLDLEVKNEDLNIEELINE